MELLLNLTWLLLAVPAYYVWRHARCVHAGRRITSAQCILALGCLLVVLFPVVSATDDLHAMRAEMEESPLSKRSIRQASSDKPSCSHLHAPSFLVLSSGPFFISAEAWNQAPNATLFSASAPAIHQAGRAPPALSLARVLRIASGNRHPRNRGDLSFS
jgi:hypothetical protein